MIHVLIIDDHFVVRSGLATSLEIEEDIRVTATADKGETAAEAYATHQPAVVLMDLQLPGISGVEATATIRAIDPLARILVFSTFARTDEIQAALDAGAAGYLQKSASREELIHALRQVAAGFRYLPADMAVQLSELQLGPAITPRESASRPELIPASTARRKSPPATMAKPSASGSSSIERRRDGW